MSNTPSWVKRVRSPQEILTESFEKTLKRINAKNLRAQSGGTRVTASLLPAFDHTRPTAYTPYDLQPRQLLRALRARRRAERRTAALA